MTILRDIASELVGMFLADALLVSLTLTLVVVVAGLTLSLDVEPLIGGTVLLVGCPAILVVSAVREAHRRPRQ